MASPAIFDKSIPCRAPAPVPPVMRVPFPAEGSSRKKAGSVNFGRQPWKTEEREDQRVSQNVSRVLSESLLPHALFDHKSLKFAATVVAVLRAANAALLGVGFWIGSGICDFDEI